MSTQARQGIGKFRYVLYDFAAAAAYEVFDLQVYDRSFVVGGKAEVASIAQNAFPAGVSIPNFRGRSAVNIHAVENCEYRVTGIDRCGVGAADFHVEARPLIPPLLSGRQRRDGRDLGGVGQRPRVQDVVPQAL
jgi:hypothetical protein